MLHNTVKVDFCAGHRLPDHPGKCRHLHGHNYSALVTLELREISFNLDRLHLPGYIMDFADLKQAVRDIVETLDHSMILWEKDPVLWMLQNQLPHDIQRWTVLPHPPTAENIALHIARRIADYEPVKLVASAVLCNLSETPSCSVMCSVPVHNRE